MLRYAAGIAPSFFMRSTMQRHPIVFTARILTATLLLLATAPTFAADPAAAAHPHAVDRITSLTLPQLKFEPVPAGSVRLKRGPIELVLVDNQAHKLDEAPNHRAGYNGVAVLKHERQPRTPFVPEVSGLNFEHIHDGTKVGLVEKFEPRMFPMQLRKISEFTYELHQPPTKNCKLESCGRYTLLADGTIEYTFECIPRDDTYRHKFIGLFWASYMHQPEDMSIFFPGRESKRGDAKPAAASRLINAVTPGHGIEATHPPVDVAFRPTIDDDFPLKLVGGTSRYVHTKHWYYGVCRGMAFVQVFRPRDQVWLAQSPSGGGKGNPAWDFQWFVNDYKVGEAYGFTMRAAYVPYESPEQIEKIAERLQREMETSPAR